MRGGGWIIAALLGGLGCAGLTGCAPAPVGVDPAAATGPGPTVQVPAPQPDVATAPVGVVDDVTGEPNQPVPSPTWDQNARAAAIDAATGALGAFARPGVDPQAWWNDLAPLLTDQARQDYAAVDPANVPATRITGPGVITDDFSAYVAAVRVPTDVGQYTVDVVRADADAPWLVARLRPPEANR